MLIMDRPYAFPCGVIWTLEKVVDTDYPSFRAIQLHTSLLHDFSSVARETLCGLLAVQEQQYLQPLDME